MVDRNELVKIRDWVDEKITTGAEPPWSWYQLMKLREALDAILSGMQATKLQGSPLSESHSESGLRLVACNNPQEIAQHHRVEPLVQLPM